MKIVVDKEGAQVMENLLDCALKQGGMRSLDAVNGIRAAVIVAKDGEQPGLVPIKKPASPIEDD